MSDLNTASCELCNLGAGDIIFVSANWRVILVDDANYPGFVRVIWNAHVKEMTDLTNLQRTEFMNAVWAVESVVREVMQPDKINLASLGNVVPHLHWHIIPRYQDDAHFPNPIWGNVVRDQAHSSATTQARRELLMRLRIEVAKRLRGD